MYQAFRWDAAVRPADAGADEPGATSTVLGLPKFDVTVPAAYASGDQASILMFARRLAQTDVLKAEDRSVTDPLRLTLENVLKREINAVAGNMQMFPLRFHFTTDHMTDDGYGPPTDGESISLVIDMVEDYSTIRLDRTIGYLNKIHPDLGQTLYAVMEHAGKASLQVHTFGTVRWRFQEELNGPEEWELAPGESEEEFTRYDFTEMETQFPYPWIGNAQAVLSPRAIARIGRRRGLDINVKEAISAALEIADLYEDGKDTLGSFSECKPVYALAMVAFADYDPTQQLVDDVYAIADESSDYYTPNLHEENFRFADLATFEMNWRKLIAGLRLLNALDRLVTALNKITIGVKDD